MFAFFMISTALAIVLLPIIAGYARKWRNRDGKLIYKFALSLIGEFSLVCLAVTGYNALMRDQHQYVEGVICGENMRAISKALLLYTEDWDLTLPPANRWEEAISQPKYFGTSNYLHFFNCPSAAPKGGYALNNAIGGKKLDDIEYPATTVMVFEGNKNHRNAYGSAIDLVSLGHNTYWNFAFCDGRVGWETRDSVRNIKWLAHYPGPYINM